MPEFKKRYVAPVITEVKFEDKNLVAFGICDKVGNIAATDSCCDLPEGLHNRDIQDPS